MRKNTTIINETMESQDFDIDNIMDNLGKIFDNENYDNDIKDSNCYNAINEYNYVLNR